MRIAFFVFSICIFCLSILFCNGMQQGGHQVVANTRPTTIKAQHFSSPTAASIPTAFLRFALSSCKKILRVFWKPTSGLAPLPLSHHIGQGYSDGVWDKWGGVFGLIQLLAIGSD